MFVKGRNETIYSCDLENRQSLLEVSISSSYTTMWSVLWAYTRTSMGDIGWYYEKWDIVWLPNKFLVRSGVIGQRFSWHSCHKEWKPLPNNLKAKKSPFTTSHILFYFTHAVIGIKHGKHNESSILTSRKPGRMSWNRGMYYIKHCWDSNMLTRTVTMVPREINETDKIAKNRGNEMKLWCREAFNQLIWYCRETHLWCDILTNVYDVICYKLK